MFSFNDQDLSRVQNKQTAVLPTTMKLAYKGLTFPNPEAIWHFHRKLKEKV